ncbi:Uncharacterised protein [Mycoplasmopsis maculosa]|uniref:Uncharacterized protein n=1 Tax=Mycoplasmopsis maculosa TaxID=114885 RepID=A0A449B577_9BACT|nr:hypothetical protein [Mycoplasmopsis maculosa]VEU75761.1 Uncharacterised protein [Mycoplasmopsis maculosa]
MKYLYFFTIKNENFNNNKIDKNSIDKLINKSKYRVHKIYFEDKKIVIHQSENEKSGEYIGYFAYLKGDYNGMTILDKITYKIEEILNQNLSYFEVDTLMCYIPWLIYLYETKNI